MQGNAVHASVLRQARGAEGAPKTANMEVGDGKKKRAIQKRSENRWKRGEGREVEGKKEKEEIDRDQRRLPSVGCLRADFN